jgi:hypothetical protein
MKLSNETLSYLRGEKFSNSYTIRYDYHQDIPNRINFLCDLVKGKNVLHLGCLDHLPLIDDKIKRKQWLHKELTAVASSCLGVDIEQEAQEYVKSKHGISNIILGDFTTNIPEVSNKKWDYAILGELLEHIDNPVAFLSNIRQHYHQSIRQLVITVPNAWTQLTMQKANDSSEIINTDHRYWFTPYTLSKVIMQAGMEVDSLYFANRIPLKPTQLAYKKLLGLIGRKPAYNFTYASSIVAVANLTGK